MNYDYEIMVMKNLFLFKCETNKDLTFKGIFQKTKIPESTLRDILKRLEKRKWIKKYDVWDPKKITVLHNNTDFNKMVSESNKVYRKALSEKQGSYERRRDYAREETRKKLIPKKRTGYHISIFPYLVRDLDGTTVPKGCKKKWQSEAKKIKENLKLKRIVRF